MWLIHTDIFSPARFQFVSRSDAVQIIASGKSEIMQITTSLVLNWPKCAFCKYTDTFAIYHQDISFRGHKITDSHENIQSIAQ